MVLPVIGNPERKIINKLAIKFIQRKDIGTEYFEGNLTDIIKIVFENTY
jgi:hypothetical protein